MDAGKPPQKGPKFCHIEATPENDQSVQHLVEYVQDIMKPLISDDTAEPDISRITLELPSVAYFLRSQTPLPRELVNMYSLRKKDTPTKALFPTYLRMLAEKWDDVLLAEEKAKEKERASAAE